MQRFNPKALDDYRQSRGVTCTGIVKGTGLSMTCVRSMMGRAPERGANPRVDNLLKVCVYIGADVRTLFSGEVA